MMCAKIYFTRGEDPIFQRPRRPLHLLRDTINLDDVDPGTNDHMHDLSALRAGGAGKAALELSFGSALVRPWQLGDSLAAQADFVFSKTQRAGGLVPFGDDMKREPARPLLCVPKWEQPASFCTLLPNAALGFK